MLARLKAEEQESKISYNGNPSVSSLFNLSLLMSAPCAVAVHD